MIVYAFYGLGKTTLAKNSLTFEDIDDEFVFNKYGDIFLMDKFYDKLAAKDALSNNNIYLVNLKSTVIDEDIELAFLPDNIKMIQDRLRQRGVAEDFIENICNQDVLDSLYKRFPDAIIIKEDEYLSDFKDYILEEYARIEDYEK